MRRRCAQTSSACALLRQRGLAACRRRARAPHAFSSGGNPHQAWSEKIVLSLTAALALCALCC